MFIHLCVPPLKRWFHHIYYSHPGTWCQLSVVKRVSACFSGSVTKMTVTVALNLPSRYFKPAFPSVEPRG